MWGEARERPLLAAEALQAFLHINPFAVDAEGRALAPERLIELARVGALLRVEEIASARAQLEHPMQIQFLSGGPRVIPFKLDTETPDGSPKK